MFPIIWIFLQKQLKLLSEKTVLRGGTSGYNLDMDKDTLENGSVSVKADLRHVPLLIK